MASIINPGVIVRYYLQSLKPYDPERKEKEGFWNYINTIGRINAAIMTLLPLAVVGVFVWAKWKIDKDVVNLICSCMAIFIGLFFNVVMLMFEVENKATARSGEIDGVKKAEVTKTEARRKHTRRATLHSILFSILLCVTIFCTSLVALALANHSTCWVKLVGYILTLLAVALCVEFFLVVLIILKKMFYIFHTESML